MNEDDGDEESSPVETPTVPTPRENRDLVGQEAAEAALLTAYRSGRLPHAWLLAGPRGIGKATLAFRFARFLFAQGGKDLFAPPASSLALAPDHLVFRRVASGGHPDLLVVERGVDPKRKKLRGEIVVDDTRKVAGFLRLTPAEGQWRVVILDDADLMNRNAANALLKILEEPPQARLAAAGERQSRPAAADHSLALPHPGLAAVAGRARQRCRSSAIARISASATGRCWRGLATAASAVRSISPPPAASQLYRSLVKLIAQLPDLDGAQLHALADGVLRGDSEEAFRLLSELLPGWLARMVALASGGAEAECAALPGEAETMRRLAARRGLDQWIDVWEKLTELFAQAESVNLDRKQTC